ncbi:hypothetical protein ACQ86N_04605 [Puia sp. P3]|uniref:hypothetical protein n=1 Tax=Puia sp. P3 TaxID=3423952 RepID=UPI003D67C8D3
MKPLFLVLAALLPVSALFAQQWTAIDPPDNIFNNVISTTVIDKAGNVYAAGEFTNGSHKHVVATLSNGKWIELGGSASLQASGGVYALTTNPAGNLIAAGGFVDATGNYYVAKWDGTQWTELGTGANALHINGIIYALTTDPAGNVYIGGSFSDGAGNFIVMKWDGVHWTTLGSGNQSLRANGLIYSIVADGAGSVYAAGSFTNAGGAYYVARWDGSSWTETGSGAGALGANSWINCIRGDKSGKIYAGGDFHDTNGDRYVAVWDGSGWNRLGGTGSALQFNDAIQSMVIDPAGNLYTGGRYNDAISGAFFVAKWDGATWTSATGVSVTATPNDVINSISVDSTGKIYAAGRFKDFNGDYYVAVWDGGKWNEPGLYGAKLHVGGHGISALTVDKAGYVYVTGDLQGNANGVTPVVERWDGTGWSQPGGGENFAGAAGTATCVLADGDYVYLSGDFQLGNQHHYLAKWDGSTWSEVGDFMTALGPTGKVDWMARDGRGNIYLSGNFSTGYKAAKWDGKSWQPYIGGVDWLPYFVSDPAGDLYYGDSYYEPVGGLREFSNGGYNWTELGGIRYPDATNKFNALAFDSKGNLYAGGSVTNAADDSYVMKWNGQFWDTVGGSAALSASYPINSIVVDAADNVYVAGGLSKGLQEHMAKWNGSSWSWIDMPIDYTGPGSGPVNALTLDGKGNLFAAGSFYDEHGNFYVIKYQLADTQYPVISAIPPVYCSTQGVQTASVVNLPGDASVGVTVQLDGSPIVLQTGGSFSYDVDRLSAGTHRIVVGFSYGSEVRTSTDSFLVRVASTPVVRLSASQQTVAGGDVPVHLTAVNAGGEESVPFSRLRATGRSGIFCRPLRLLIRLPYPSTDSLPASTGSMCRCRPVTVATLLLLRSIA